MDYLSTGCFMKEADIQSNIMIALGEHPLVAWCYVTTTGTFKGLKGGAKYKIGIPGMPDIMGQMRDGRILGIEVKKPGDIPKPIQDDFLNMIHKNGGVCGWCDCVNGAIEIIEG